MGSISNHHTILLAHSYSSSQPNPFYPQFINFPKIPCRTSYPLLSSSLVNLIANRTPRCVVTAKKKTPSSESVLSPSIVEEVTEDDDFEEFDDEGFDDDDDFEDEYLDEDAETRAGDGGGGGGISLAGTKWDKQVLEIAEQVSLAFFDGELGIYAFKTLQNSAIRVRIERLTNKSGSPTMEDIEAFSKAYRERLNEAEADGSIPDISLEVSSPGLERMVRVPQDLERFKDRSMYVKYKTDVGDECDGVLRLESFDLETRRCIWGLADVKVNREKAGKGRPLNKKQKEWRLDTPFESLVLVRIYADF